MTKSSHNKKRCSTGYTLPFPILGLLYYICTKGIFAARLLHHQAIYYKDMPNIICTDVFFPFSNFFWCATIIT